ncbi:GNAT family N-acetyltransferase [Brachybacterium sp. P6-10-X1]|uniref:GNAT family N-acetyltransferase n=1 Tax=Brachybacterium sp. P6-10-X1 TaxID=1903186 RepID=UPI0009719D7D|nr:GNAT family N-acetyltransferase [Brachybacterium sp. P6-10-X1]APX33214.1 GNAT family N-acetyltransferase [Brachybacterium sp. P6-10-X1]
MTIDEATDASVPAITAIYNDAVRSTTAVWNSSTVDLADRAEWLAEHRAAGHPVLVALDDELEVVGYATFGDWRAWEGYRYTVEHSVYVRGDQRGQGIGEQLLVELISRARELGKHVLVAGIEAGNAASIGLHEKLGFRQVGFFPQVGRKFDRWLDLVFLQLTLGEEPVRA